MQNLRVGLFALAVIGFFVFFANSIPQIESRPPAEVQLSSNMTPQQFAAAGRQIMDTKGGCFTCHGFGTPGTRAPDLQGVGARAGTRRPGYTAEQYLREHLIAPCGYVVPGYQCLMTPFNKPPVSLSDVEIDAVIAYLESLGGEITVKPRALTSSSSSSSTSQVTAANTPQEIMAAMGCGACHTIAGMEGMVGKVGPELTHIGTVGGTRQPGLSARDYIIEHILDPNSFIPPDCPTGPCKSPSDMPTNFGDRLTAKQLETLVGFLAGLK